ncbi:von Willebrand factor D and EGF domain-containing protein isoform X2 [Patella vulgata]|nr:von Willebrand factor D and EGF domain-containing protein isoform X2 [Patella vulgata]
MFQVTCNIVVVLFIIPGWISVLDGVEVQLAIPCNKTCLHGGRCDITPDPTCSGSGYKQICNCPSSYTGEFCENVLIKVECDKLCQNGGRCVVNFKYDGCTTAYSSCVCPKYYYGDLCDIFRTDPICDPPCTAGQGECVVLRNSQLAPHLTDRAYCNCSMSATGYYYGNQCQHYQEKGLCNPPCRNGGECNYRGMCICPQDPKGYSRDCREFDPVCNPACQNGGTCYYGSCGCTSTDQGYYNGSACEQFQSNICNPACQNGGTCNRGSCQCTPTDQGYYYGSACEHVDLCKPACQNGGKCYRGYCQCTITAQGYYYGSACEKFKILLRGCSPPCENGSVCRDGTCQCNVNGSNCSTVEECVGGCLNGGTCDYRGKCKCLMEYTGVNCETYTGCPCLNNGRCSDDVCQCTINETGAFTGDLCTEFTFLYPCYPSVLNGGWCVAGTTLCPYDDVGYFHGDQCEKYSLKSCNGSCIEPEVCSSYGCTCPYNLTERSFTFTNANGRCQGTLY